MVRHRLCLEIQGKDGDVPKTGGVFVQRVEKHFREQGDTREQSETREQGEKGFIQRIITSPGNPPEKLIHGHTVKGGNGENIRQRQGSGSDTGPT